MRKLFSQIIAGVLGFWLASLFVPGVRISPLPDSSFLGISLSQSWQFFLFLGIALGLINYFVRPIINIIAFPIRLLTLGLFGLMVNMLMIWFLDLMLKEVSVPWMMPLFWTSLMVFGLGAIVSKIATKED